MKLKNLLHILIREGFGELTPKISIIVPVYKVEAYLHKCVDSILAQTFKEFELILIDDGSPDRCAEICDQYASKDHRVKVIHKDNGGLASARNSGLDLAIGEYIGFVDSDDWIEPDMFEMLFNICVENNCDIANCSSEIHYKDKTVKNGGHPLTIHTRAEAMRVMLEGKLYDEVVWTKLFKRTLIKDIRFTTGIVYEDTAFTYKVLHQCERVGCVGKAKYHYIKRDNSTMDKAVKNIRIDAVMIYKDMLSFMNQHYKELSPMVVYKLGNSAMAVLNLISSNGMYKEHKESYYKVAQILNSYFKQTISQKKYPNTVKLLLTCTKIHPLFYKWIINSRT
ncbi:glycosyltransferase [Peribacillus sp. NPDC097197]|uniref:glycosyltransferase n=1 Tax=Peribacillus sp. NPDC097197 TaxID=3390615 RepID=UPI003D08C2AD